MVPQLGCGPEPKISGPSTSEPPQLGGQSIVEQPTEQFYTSPWDAREYIYQRSRRLSFLPGNQRLGCPSRGLFNYWWRVVSGEIAGPVRGSEDAESVPVDPNYCWWIPRYLAENCEYYEKDIAELWAPYGEPQTRPAIGLSDCRCCDGFPDPWRGW